MIKGFKFILILLLFSSYLFSQVPDIESQILESKETKSTIISKGRKLLLDKFIEGDLNKVREIKDFLAETEDDNYIVFYPSEYWLILYSTKDYNELVNDIQSIDSLKLTSYNTRISPPEDLLYVKLLDKTIENETQLKKQIQESDLNAENKQILIINLDWLLLESRKNIFARDSLNNEVDKFITTYPRSRYEDYTKKYIRYKIVPKNWGLTYEFFSGYSLFTGSLSDNYTNNVPIGIAFDVCYKNFELYLRDYIGFNKTKTNHEYSLGTFEKGSRLRVFLPEASLGYVVHNDNRFKLSPFVGIGSMDISPPTADKEEIPELKEVSLEFTSTYIMGVNFDIKFGKKDTPAYNSKTNYGFMRIRYGYSIPNFEKKYIGVYGNMHYITIGFGVMTRGSKREY